MSTVTIIGYYGAGNFGDDLILSALVDGLRNVDSTLRINVVLDKIGRASNVEGLLGEGVSIYSQEGMRWFQRYSLLIQILFKTDILFWGGGTCFSDEDGMGGFWSILVGKFLWRKVGYLGVGVGNVKKFWNKIKLAIVSLVADFMVFRDSQSFSMMKKKFPGFLSRHFFEARDLVYAYDFIDERTTKVSSVVPGIGSLCISWRDLSNFLTEESERILISGFVSEIAKLVSCYNISRVNLLPLDNSVDLHAHEVLRRKMKTAGIDASILVSKDVFGKIGQLKAADFIISMRMHGAMVGVVLGVPTIGIEYSPKVGFLFQEMFLENNFVKLDDLKKDGFLQKMVQNVLRSHSSKKNAQYCDMNRKLALKNFEILSGVVRSV